MKNKEKKTAGKKPSWGVMLALVVLLAAAVGAAVFLTQNTFIDGQMVSTDVQVLDLRGTGTLDVNRIKRLSSLRYLDIRGIDVSEEALAELRGALSECEIVYDIGVGGVRCAPDTASLTLEDLPADWENIARLKALKSLSVQRCTDPAAMAALAEKLPGGCAVNWSAGIGGDWYDTAVSSLEIPGDAVYFEELLSQLRWFPALRSVRLPAAVLTPENQRSLLAAYPDVTFYWSVDAGGLRIPSDAAELTFAEGESADVKALESVLDLLGSLKTVDFTGSAVSAGDRLAFRDDHPELDVRWSVALRDNFYGCDTQLLEFNNIAFTQSDLDELEAVIPYLPDLAQIELCDTGLDYETLDALNQKYKDIEVVWSIRFGYNNFYKLRTDATYLRPSENGPGAPAITDEDTKILRYCHNMQGLDLGHHAITDLSFLYDMPHIKYLIFCETSISDITPLSSLKELEYLELFITDVEDLTPLTECPALRALNICYIKAKQDAAWKALSKMKDLEWLWYCNCPLSADQMRQLTNRENLTTFFLRGGESSGGTWRYSPYYYEMRKFFNAPPMPGGTYGVDPDNPGTQIIIDDAGQWFYLENFDMDQYWWKQERYSMYHPYIIGLTA